MAIDPRFFGIKAPAKVSKPPKRRPKNVVPSKFSPGGLTDEDIYKETNEASKRIDEQIARDREISKVPYRDRLNQARQGLSDSMYGEDSRTLRGEDVWRYGCNNALFIESERNVVLEDQESFRTSAREKQEEKSKYERRKFESDKERAWEAKGKQLSAPETIIQPFVVAAAAGIGCCGILRHAERRDGR